MISGARTHRIPYPQPVDKTQYAPEAESPRVLYGLPAEVRFCRECVISNQRPNSAIEYQHTAASRKSTISFDANGVCDACNVARRKREQIDWQHREQQLRILCARYRRSDGGYDCLVPGSGGKDSFYASHILKTKFGMHPLTVTWAPHIYTDWGFKNFQSWIHAGHDNYLMTPNGRVHRLLTRLSTELLFHPFQAFMLGQKALAPKMAAMFGIPLVFYGENEAEYGNPVADFEAPQRSTAYFASHESDVLHLGGVAVSELKSEFGLTDGDLLPYMPASAETLAAHKIEVQYLGYYLRWHPQGCYYYAVEHGGFTAAPERTPGTYSKYNSIDDRVDDFHYLTTGIKYGIGRATYDASQEIRSGEINREEGVALVRKFDHEFPERFADEFLRYVSLPASEFPDAARQFEQPIMTREYFEVLTNKSRSPHLWTFHSGAWHLRHAVWHESRN